MDVEKAEKLGAGNLLVKIINLRKQETVNICIEGVLVLDRSLGVENTACSNSIGICY